MKYQKSTPPSKLKARLAQRRIHRIRNPGVAGLILGQGEICPWQIMWN
jgi:hypothetical protein